MAHPPSSLMRFVALKGSRFYFYSHHLTGLELNFRNYVVYISRQLVMSHCTNIFEIEGRVGRSNDALLMCSLFLFLDETIVLLYRLD